MDKKAWIAAAALVVAIIGLCFGTNLIQQITGCSIFDTLRQSCPTPNELLQSPEAKLNAEIPSSAEDILGILTNWRPGTPECGQELAGDELTAIYETIPTIPGYETEIALESIYANDGWQETAIGLNPEDILLISYVGGIWGFAENENNCGIGNTWWEDRDLTGGEAAQQGSLMGKLGNYSSFFVGNHLVKAVDVYGALAFRINDDLLTDNHGYLTFLVVRFYR